LKDMATFDARVVRAVAIELELRIQALYGKVQPIFETVATWEITRTDPFLPSPFQVSVQLSSYRAIEPERLRLDEYVNDLLTAGVDDTLSYPPPPSGGGSGFADGEGLADGSQHADGSGA
jgi:hypothetical protein